MRNEPLLRVLIVDDTPGNIQLLGESLREDYKVQIATSGKKALQLVSQSPPDLILLDIMMPDMDGNQVCDILKNNKDYQNIPIIFITAANEIAMELKSLAQGAADFIYKPINLDVARLRIRNILDRESLRKQIAMREREQRLAASVFKYSHEGIVITDADNNILDVNHSFTRITGYELNDVLGKNPRILKSGQQSYLFYEQLWGNLLQNNYWEGEFWNRHKDGHFFAVHTSIAVIRHTSGEIDHFVAIFSDITLKKNQEETLQKIAYFDELTGMPNRTLLADRLNQAIAHCQRNQKSMAVCYLDLDGFKEVNDTYGHAAGDRLLIDVTRRMSRCLRKIDTLSRIGGDEFVLLLLDLNGNDEYVSSVERILHELQEPFLIEGHPVVVSASIGVTLYPYDHSESDLLLRHADQAMYQAKQNGKNQFFRFDSSQSEANQLLSLKLARVRLGIKNREFVLYYQPKVNLRTGEPIGVEALVRWKHPEDGVLSPGLFLPDIDDTPVMLELSDYIIEIALKQLNLWLEQGLKLSVSVNIAPCHLAEESFPAKLKQHLKGYPNLPAHLFELEILETAALSDIGQVCDAMKACMLLGVDFAIDDFGTGYSSLTYLKNLPAKTLKIDQTFIRDMLADPDDRAIVIGTMGLAKAFHRKVVAEGVESIAHGKELLEIGCEVAQGYAIGYPMPAEDIESWLENWKERFLLFTTK